VFVDGRLWRCQLEWVSRYERFKLRQVYAYSVKLYNCGAGSTAPSRADADQSCARSDSAWPACLSQVDAVTDCLQTDCSTWESSCATEINELTAPITDGGPIAFSPTERGRC
jgi:hypothetical protein